MFPKLKKSSSAAKAFVSAFLAFALCATPLTAAFAADEDLCSQEGIELAQVDASEDSLAGLSNVSPESPAGEALGEAAEDEAGSALAEEGIVQGEGEASMGTDGQAASEGQAVQLGSSVSLASTSRASASTGMKATYVEEYDASAGLPTSDANAWQEASQSYSEVKAGDGQYTYSEDDAVRLQKAVMANGTENEFQVYLNVEPQLSWEEFFKSLDNYSTHNNASSFNPSSGCSRMLSQDEYDALSSTEKGWYAKINVRYNMGDGTYYDVVRYGNFFGNGKEQIQDAPNGSYAWSSEKFNTNGLIRSIDWKSLVADAQSGSSNLRLEIDASSLKKTYSFATDPVYPKSVSDPMGSNIVFEGMISADKGDVKAPDVGSKDGTIEWTLPTAAPPDPPYYGSHTEPGTIPGTNVSGDVTVLENVVVVNRNGKQTAYYTNILQMRYGISLDVLGDGFTCCGNPSSDSSQDALVATNGTTSLRYQVGGSSKATVQTAEFPIPQVRGVLYDLEIAKADEDDPSKMLAGATFELLDEGGNVVTDSSGAALTAISGSDGMAKFRNLPYGTYFVHEVSPPPGYAVSDSSPHGPYELCWTTNSANLTGDHSGKHECDKASDVNNVIMASDPDVVYDKHAVGLEILKQDGDTKEPLQGVKFALKVDDGDEVFTDADNPAQAWSDMQMTIPCSEGATDNQGKLTFYGLKPGTYWIVETWTLAGYQNLGEPVKMVITQDNKVLFHESGVQASLDEGFIAHITIDNYKILELPEAGSAGRLCLQGFGMGMTSLSMLALRQRGRRRFD